jgi:Holliday junction DNA helicase RuvA
MFYYLSGTVAEIEANLVVIDCGGVGYACATTNYTLSQIKKGEQAKLFTYLHVREDAFDLFGFFSKNELSSFKMLISVSGVGPKAALAILSSTTPSNLALAIVTGDEKSLTAAPGIGKKIAQRIILELKDKLAKEQREFSVESGAPVMAVSGSKIGEATAALAVLGYSQAEINMALHGLPAENLPLEELIRQALKKMVK